MTPKAKPQLIKNTDQNDLFDMNQGNFEEYQIEQSAIEKDDDEDSTQNMEVY